MKVNSPHFSSYFSSATGQKFLMALSGAALLGFIIGHLVGNLQIFIGQNQINAYAVFLRQIGELLWIVRIGLIVMVVIHIWTSIQLTVENNRARPVAYEEKKYIKASTASRTMMWSGTVVLAFLIYHLLHFTFLKVHPQYGHLTDSLGRHDVYSMMVLSFQQWPISLVYIVCVFLLCFHLSHGISSMFQSLGFNTTRFRRRLSAWGARVAWLIFLGYAAIPTGVLLGMVKLPPGVHP
jgi:succinate dehydrogenase / fumarate reductase, cytochrome b subunit